MQSNKSRQEKIQSILRASSCDTNNILIYSDSRRSSSGPHPHKNTLIEFQTSRHNIITSDHAMSSGVFHASVVCETVPLDLHPMTPPSYIRRRHARRSRDRRSYHQQIHGHKSGNAVALRRKTSWWIRQCWSSRKPKSALTSPRTDSGVSDSTDCSTR